MLYFRKLGRTEYFANGLLSKNKAYLFRLLHNF